MKKKTAKQQMNLMKLFQEFDTSEECRTYLKELRWPDGVKCPRCQSEKISRIRERNQFDCDSCRYQFSVTAGSIFHDSHLPLPKWFAAVYLMCEARKGVSANQLKRTLSISYKTAWYLCHRIRKAMEEAVMPKLRGVVEVDETYIGGKRRHVGGGNVDNKTLVLGAVERGGAIRLRVERRKKASKKTLHAFIGDMTAPDTKRLITDENPGYLGIADEDTTHETVNHRAEEWVRGDVHTNSIEGVWSLFKRSVVGSFHQVSAKHLDRYLDEFEWRFNGRKNPYLFRDTMLRLLHAGAMTYQKLIA
jgi:transposase-like protein